MVVVGKLLPTVGSCEGHVHSGCLCCCSLAVVTDMVPNICCCSSVGDSQPAPPPPSAQPPLLASISRCVMPRVMIMWPFTPRRCSPSQSSLPGSFMCT